MPRIDAVRIGPFWLFAWVAFNVTDFGEYRCVALGVTREHAIVRSLRKHDRMFP